MLKPYRIHDAENRASSFSRRPIVLARLPFVGQEVSPPGEYHPEHERAPQAMPPAPAQVPQQPNFESLAAPHLESRSFLADDQVTSEYNSPRIDPGHQATEIQAPEVQQPEIQAPANHQSNNEQHSWTRSAKNPGGLYQLQKQLATNSGLIVTLALVASALFLYMAIIAPVEPPTVDYSNSYEFYGENQAVPQTNLPDTEMSSEAQVNSLDLPADPFEVGAAESGRAALVQGDNSSIGGTPTRPKDRVAAAIDEELKLAPSHSGISKRPEVVQLPTIDEDSGNVELIFDDASAFTYPHTPQPIFDFGPLNITDDPADAPSRESASKSAVANRPQFN